MNIFNQALTRLDKYIWFKAHKFGQNLHGMDVNDLYQEGLIKLYEVYTASQYAGKPVEELDRIFKSALQNAYLDIREKAGNSTSRLNSLEELFYADGDCLDLDSVFLESWSVNAFEEVYLKHYQEHLAHYVSSEAAILLDTLLNPTPAVMRLFNIQNMRRRHLRNQGVNVHLCRKINNQLTGQALGFSPSKTKALIRELQQAWRLICQTDRPQLNAAMC